jgi:hypothetical protein
MYFRHSYVSQNFSILIKLIEHCGTSYDMRLVYHESTIEDIHLVIFFWCCKYCYLSMKLAKLIEF